MSQSLRSSEAGTDWHPRDWEAHLLSGLLRDSRVSALYGDAGAGKTTLLQDYVRPLLQRRSTDTVKTTPGAPRSSVVAFSERRQRPRTTEVVVFFDQWDGDPMRALRDHLATLMGAPPPGSYPHLGDLLYAWHAQHGTRFLLLFDGFENCLNGSATSSTLQGFISELIAIINDTSLPAHVLLSLRSDAEPALLRLKQRISGFDRHWLRLPHWQRKQRRRPSPDAAFSGAPAQATTSASESGFVRFDLTEEPDAPEDSAFAPTTMPAAAAPAPAPRSAPAASTSRSTPALKWLSAAIGAASLVMLIAVILMSSRDDELRPPEPPKEFIPDTAVAPVVVAPPAPRRTLASDMAWLAPAVAAGANTWPDGFTPVTDDPPLAVARYDALQAARKTQAPGSVQIVAPFLTEHLHVVTRADSPLIALHDIENSTLAIGASRSADALTARTLYQNLFGRPLPPAQARELDPGAALKELIGSRSIDAMVIATPHPSDWLAGLDSTTRQAIKLLPLDAMHPSTQRVTQRYLPTAATGPTAPSLAVMSFLVTHGTPTPSTTEALGRFVTTLCQKLPLLQRDGHVAWRTVTPALHLNVGWPYAPAADQAQRTCPS